MNFIVLTIFPEMFNPFWEHGIIKRAIGRNKILASAINIRDFAQGKHRTTDDRPYGGGPGMVMKVEPLRSAIEDAKQAAPASHTAYLSPQGRPLDHAAMAEIAQGHGWILIAGRYEGIGTTTDAVSFISSRNTLTRLAK